MRMDNYGFACESCTTSEWFEFGDWEHQHTFTRTRSHMPRLGITAFSPFYFRNHNLGFYFEHVCKHWRSPVLHITVSEPGSNSLILKYDGFQFPLSHSGLKIKLIEAAGMRVDDVDYSVSHPFCRSCGQSI